MRIVAVLGLLVLLFCRPSREEASLMPADSFDVYADGSDVTLVRTYKKLRVQ